MSRSYRLGRRQTGVDRTTEAILAAARRLVEERPSATVSLGEVAKRAGVARVTVYNRFGSRGGLLDSLAPQSPDILQPEGDARSIVRRHFAGTCAAWAANPALHRHLPPAAGTKEGGPSRRLAEALAAADALRPGCSIREAEDVLAGLSSFAVFDRLHQDGRRATSAVTEILVRLAEGILDQVS